MEKITVDQYCKERDATPKYVSQYTDYILFHKGDLGDPGVGIHKQRPPKYWFKHPVYSYKLPYDKNSLRSIRKQIKAGKIKPLVGQLQATYTTMWTSSEVAPTFSELESQFYRNFDYRLYCKGNILMCDIVEVSSKQIISSTRADLLM